MTAAVLRGLSRWGPIAGLCRGPRRAHVECTSSRRSTARCARHQHTESAAPVWPDGVAFQPAELVRVPHLAAANRNQEEQLQTSVDLGLQILPEVITEGEEEALVAEVQAKLRRKKYQGDHWDGVREVKRRLPFHLAHRPCTPICSPRRCSQSFTLAHTAGHFELP